MKMWSGGACFRSLFPQSFECMLLALSTACLSAGLGAPVIYLQGLNSMQRILTLIFPCRKSTDSTSKSYHSNALKLLLSPPSLSTLTSLDCKPIATAL